MAHVRVRDGRHDALPERVVHLLAAPRIGGIIPGRRPLLGDGYVRLEFRLLEDVIDAHSVLRPPYVPATPSPPRLAAGRW